MRREQDRFRLWGKVWGLKLPLKFQLFIWKVNHRIIAVKDALIRRGIKVLSECAHCGHKSETIEHLFFKCDFAKRVWRASQLAFDFDCGHPMAFGDWLSADWLESALDDDAIRDSIVLLWSIWCMRNEAVFRNDCGSIDNALSLILFRHT